MVLLLRFQNLQADQYLVPQDGNNPHLILTINSPLDIPRLNKCHHVPFDLLRRPSKCSAHSREFNGRERLEIEYHGRVFDQVYEVVDMRCEMDIDVMSSLGLCISNPDKYKNVKLTEYRSRSSSTDLKLLPM